MEDNGIKLENRLTKLEEAVKELSQDILDIKQNHIQHIYRKLESTGKITVGILVTLVANLVGVIISILK